MIAVEPLFNSYLRKLVKPECSVKLIIMLTSILAYACLISKHNRKFVDSRCITAWDTSGIGFLNVWNVGMLYPRKGHYFFTHIKKEKGGIIDTDYHAC